MQASAPCIFIGQISVQLGYSIQELEEFCSISSISQNNFLFIDQDNPMKEKVKPSNKKIDSDKFKTTSTNLHLEKCNHSLLDDQNCVCLGCQSNIDKLVENTRNLLECQDVIKLLFVSTELHSSFGCWTYDRIIDIIEAHCSSKVLGTLLMLPPLGCSGAENYLASYTTAQAISSSTFTMIRGYDEYYVNNILNSQLFTSSESLQRKAPVQDLSDISHRIACDLWPAIGPNDSDYSTQSSQFTYWPYNICSESSKIIDVRSTLYNFLSKKKVQSVSQKKSTTIASGEQHSPHRILASSMHHLHEAYASRYSIENSCRLACFGDQHISSIFNFRSKSAESISDIKKIMKHSNPGVDWHYMDETLAHPNQKNESQDGKSQLSLFSFQSPYGECEVRKIANNTRKLMNIGGYANHLKDGGFLSTDIIYDSLQTIDNYLDQVNCTNRVLF